MADVPDYHVTVGTPGRPYDDIYIKDDQGDSQSLREALKNSSGVPEQPFIVDKNGDVVMVARGNQGSNDPSNPTGGFLLATYVGDNLPGDGQNTLPNGYSRFWCTLTGKVYLVTRVLQRYFWVEATDRDG